MPYSDAFTPFFDANSVANIFKSKISPFGFCILACAAGYGERPLTKILKEDCYIDWSRSGKEIYDFVRGLSPYPAAHAKIQNPNGEILDLKIFATELASKNDVNASLYSIKTDQKTYLEVVLKDFCIKILEIQQAGKKAMGIMEFLRGTRVSDDWKLVV